MEIFQVKNLVKCALSEQQASIVCAALDKAVAEADFEAREFCVEEYRLTQVDSSFLVGAYGDNNYGVYADVEL